MPDTTHPPARTVLVLGAGGFIGGRLVAALADAGLRPVAGVRRRRRASDWQGAEVRLCDATDPVAVERVLDGVDAVVNCVGGDGRTMIAATRALCAAARRRPRRIVHLSSIAVYGDATGPVTEQTPLVAPADGYGMAKRACEALIEDYVRDGGDAVLLRPSCVYGPGSEQWTARLARLLRAGRVGDLGSAGDGCCNLIYIDDLAAAVLAAQSYPELSGQTFNVTSPAVLTWNEYLTRFGRLLDATPIQRIAPRRLVAETRLAAPALRLGQMALRAVGAPSRLLPDAITPSLARLFRQEIWFETADESAPPLLARQTSLEVGLRESVRWLSGPPAWIERHGAAPGLYAP
jgi:2-alkyl-3-oxoalkanoate reductase